MQWGKSLTCTDSGIYPTYLHNGRDDRKQIIHTCKTYNLVGAWISPFEHPYMQGQIWLSNQTPTGWCEPPSPYCGPKCTEKMVIHSSWMLITHQHHPNNPKNMNLKPLESMGLVNIDVYTKGTSRFWKDQQKPLKTPTWGPLSPKKLGHLLEVHFTCLLFCRPQQTRGKPQKPLTIKVPRCH